MKTDFPYYNGVPTEVSPAGWLIVLASVAAAFLLLILLPFPTTPLNFLPAIAFTGLPLIALAVVTGGRHTALFRPVGVKEVGLAIGFGILTIVVSLIVGLILSRLTAMTGNPGTGGLASLSTMELIAFLARTAIQLVGEELMTILPLLAVLWLCVRKLNLSRRLGLVIAVIVSTIWFSAVHLPTYNWNLIQCFGGIGAARLVLTSAFLVTRNLWVAAGAHIVNDWTEFLVGTLGTHGPIDPTA